MTHSKIARIAVIGTSAIIAILVIGGLFITYTKNTLLEKDSAVLKTGIVTLANGTSLQVRIADTPTAQTQGLSGTKVLGSDEGMLFIFPKPDRYSFWMKDMLIPIDIVWISADKKVVDITPNLTPETYPTAFSSSEPAQYVLEIASGSASVLDIHRGDAIRIDF